MLRRRRGPTFTLRYPVAKLAKHEFPALTNDFAVILRAKIEGIPQGVRQNTPIAPAIRLGATHVLVVGTSRLVRGVTHSKPLEAPSLTFLLGKIMNALLLDHLDSDLGFVNLLNDILQSGKSGFGSEFVPRLNEAAAMRGGHQFRPIETLVIRPTEGIGQLAAEHLRTGKLRVGPLFTKRLLKLLDLGVSDDADLASYLLFDGAFCQHLIELGRSDARARRNEIKNFLGEVEEPSDAPPESSRGESGWRLPPTAVS